MCIVLPQDCSKTLSLAARRQQRVRLAFFGVLLAFVPPGQAQAMNLPQGSTPASMPGGVGAAHAQDRSRSPALPGACGLPADHRLAALGCSAALSVTLPAAVPEDREWFTSDTALDCWVLKAIPAPAVRAGLSMVPMPERKHIIRTCMSKEHAVRSLSNYFQGCIRKAISAEHFVGSNAVPGRGPSPNRVQQVARPLVSSTSPASAEVSVAPCDTRALPTVGNSPVIAVPSSVSQAASASRVGGTGGAVGNDTAETPSWAKGCLALLNCKSRLIRLFSQQLDEGSKALLFSLPPEHQVHIAVAVCVANTTTSTPSELCRGFVATFTSLTERPPVTAPPASQALPLVILHVGSVVGNGHVCMKAAFATVLRDLRSAQIHVLEMHSCLVSSVLAKVETASTKILGARCQVWHDAAALQRLCQERVQQWAQQGARIMVMANMDGMQAAVEVDRNSACGARAEGDSSVTWSAKDLQTAMYSLQPHIAVNKLACLCFHRLAGKEADVGILKTMFGDPHTLCPSQYGVPQEDWLAHATPALQKIIGHTEALPASVQVDGWTWPAQPGKDVSKMPSKISSALLDTIVSRLFGERELDPDELRQVNLVSMRHDEMGITRLVSRALLLHLLGFRDLPVGQCLDEVLPCFKIIIPTTGEAPPAGASGACECGHHRWCVNCEVVIMMLLNSPNAQLLSDTCSAWVRVSLESWLTNL